MHTEPSTFTTINAYLTWDFGRLDETLKDIIAGKHVERAFGHYDRGMRRHMRIEEDILLQLYAFDRTGASKASTQAIQSEHAEIIRHLDVMRAALASQDMAALKASAESLHAFLTGRHARQQEMLYPLVDSLLGANEAAKLIARLRAS